MSSTYEILLEPVLRIPGDIVLAMAMSAPRNEINAKYPGVVFDQYASTDAFTYCARGPRTSLLILKYDLEKKTYG